MDIKMRKMNKKNKTKKKNRLQNNNKRNTDYMSIIKEDQNAMEGGGIFNSESMGGMN
jgi:hypothetical protein